MTKYSLNVIQIGNSLGVILPKEALAELQADKGRALVLTSAPDGFRITPDDEEFAERMEIAHRIMKKRRKALRELAK
jgi:putative addiction module antidote